MRGRWELRKEVSLVRSWQTCICIMPSTHGWRGHMPAIRLNGTPTISSYIVRRRQKQSSCTTRLSDGLRTVNWPYILIRLKSFTVRTGIGKRTMARPSLTSWGIPLKRGYLGGRVVNMLCRSPRLSVRNQKRRSRKRFAVGVYTGLLCVTSINSLRGSI